MVGFGERCLELPVVLRHALAHADDLHRRCIMNGESAMVVAKNLRLDREQTRGALRLIRKVGVLSPERLALVAMRDWDLNDEDIGEMFSRPKEWAAAVRADAERIKASEPIPERLEFLDCGLQPEDVPPQELYKRAAELRAAGVIKGSMEGARRSSVRMHVYSFWNDYAFVHCGTR